ncbi:MAG: diacylglycerol kinase family protein [Cytophagales bacterium]|nr:MAG: diacylglycerol kinase family protein [Cytophagales bacterium]
MKTSVKPQKNWIGKHIASYKYAMQGIWFAFKNESNMSFHMVAAVGVILTNYFIQISRTEWLITLIMTGLVFMAEVFNTALEKLADRVSQEHDPLIGQVKDLASGAVLIICFVAVVVALIVYVPYLV